MRRRLAAIAELYEPAASSFLAVREAAGTLPAAAEGHRRMEHAVDVLVEEALRPVRVSPARRRTVRALLDARFWEVLAERGLDTQAKKRELAALIGCAVR